MQRYMNICKTNTYIEEITHTHTHTHTHAHAHAHTEKGKKDENRNKEAVLRLGEHVRAA